MTADLRPRTGGSLGRAVVIASLLAFAFAGAGEAFGDVKKKRRRQVKKRVEEQQEQSSAGTETGQGTSQTTKPGKKPTRSLAGDGPAGSPRGRARIAGPAETRAFLADLSQRPAALKPGPPRVVWRAVVCDAAVFDAIQDSGHLSGAARETRLGHANTNPRNVGLPEAAGPTPRAVQQMVGTPFPRGADIVSTSTHPEIAMDTALKTGTKTGRLEPGQYIRLDRIVTDGLDTVDVEDAVLKSAGLRPGNQAYLRTTPRTWEGEPGEFESVKNADGTVTGPRKPELRSIRDVQEGEDHHVNRQNPTGGGEAVMFDGKPVMLKKTLTPDERRKVAEFYPVGEHAVIGSIPPENLTTAYRIDAAMAERHAERWSAKTAAIRSLARPKELTPTKEAPPDYRSVLKPRRSLD